MVADSGKTPGTGTYKPVNTPEPVIVGEDSFGLPIAVKMGRSRSVAAIEDRWRIDDEWWRSEPVSRLYYAIVLQSGERLVIYKDIISACWYRQSY